LDTCYTSYLSKDDIRIAFPLGKRYKQKQTKSIRRDKNREKQ